MSGLWYREDLDVIHVSDPSLLEAVLCQLGLDPGVLAVDDRHSQIFVNVGNSRDDRIFGPGKIIAQAKTQIRLLNCTEKCFAISWSFT